MNDEDNYPKLNFNQRYAIDQFVDDELIAIMNHILNVKVDYGTCSMTDISGRTQIRMKMNEEINVNDLDLASFQASCILFEKMKIAYPSSLPALNSDGVMMIEVSSRGGMTKTAGIASLRHEQIRYSKEFFLHATDEAKRQVIIHEVCHLYAYKYFGHTGHGLPWQNLMTLMGAKPDRYWRQDNCLTDSDEARAAFQKKLIDFNCPGCNLAMKLSKNKMTRIRNKTKFYRCARCNTRLN